MRYFGIIDAVNRLFGYNSATQNNYYTFQQVGDTVPEWIDTTNKFILYDQIPELQAVINRYSNMVASAQPVIKDSEGAIIESNNHFIFNLLERPNAMQSWKDFIYFLAVNDCITNNYLALKNKGTFETYSITPIAYNNVKIVPTGKSYKQISVNGIIDSFKVPLNNMNSFETFKPNEVIYVARPDGINLFNTNSRLDALKYPLSNIAKTYEKRNVLLKNLFALGILSMDNNDGISSLPIDDKEKQEMQKDLMRRNKGKVIITDKKAKWDAMSFPTKDLMLFEEMTADKAAIIDAYGLNVNMFAPIDNKGQTFSNVEMGEKQAYRSTIIPDTTAMYAEIGRQLDLDKEGMYLCPDFSGVDVLAKDKKEEAETMNINANTIQTLRENGILLNEEQQNALLGL